VESKNFTNDIFIARYSEKGAFENIYTIEGADHEYSYNMLSSADDYFYMAGNFDQKIQFSEKTDMKGSGNDGFLTRFYDCSSNPKIDMGDDVALCGNSYLLKTPGNFSTYLLNEKTFDKETLITESGLYAVTATDDKGCRSEDTVRIRINPYPVPDLGDDIKLVQGEETILQTRDLYDMYSWNDGSSASILRLNTADLKPGKYDYFVDVTDRNNCGARDSVVVEVMTPNTADIHTVNKDLEESVGIYPNPNRGQFVLDFDKTSQFSGMNYEIWNAEGQVLSAGKISEKEVQKDINIHAPAGVYRVVLKKEGKIAGVKEFVIAGR
jgi:hypothetical protein